MINEKEYSFYGFVPISYQGFLDMPLRVGDTFYDWGDYIEPLVHEDDIFWKARTFIIKVLFDNRLTNISFRDSVNSIANIKGYFELNTKYGTFNVKLKEVKKDKHYNDGKVVWNLIFREDAPLFENLELPITGTSQDDVVIDGHGLFKDFKAIVSKVKLNDNIASLNESPVTRFRPDKPLTDFRLFKTIEITSVIQIENYGKINLLHSLLSRPDYRYVNHKDIIYKCFIADGFKAVIGRSVIKFTIKLNILSQANFVARNLFGDGLFTYGNERKYLKSLFEYPLFKTGFSQ